MATQEKTWNVANRLHSLKDSDNPAVNHIIAGADEIYDDEKGAKQSDINAQADVALADRYTKAETYSKEQLDSLITTPDVNYVTVATFADLPQTGQADTIYRVSSYDGTQVDASKYALYAWNGATYQLLAVRSAADDGVFDVSKYNSGDTYETLASALAAVPASVQKGGMSIKFILRTNTGTEEEPVYHDEYVQYRLMNTAWSTVAGDWQGVDSELIAGSRNLVESGVVQKELALGAVYDVTAKNPTAGPNNDGKFDSLSALLSDANLNTLIPAAARKGGMSIKFVCSSDNKYVQYRLMSDTFNTTVANWQGVDDVPTARSGNMVKSGGVYSEIKSINDEINGKTSEVFTAQMNIAANTALNNVNNTKTAFSLPAGEYNFSYENPNNVPLASLYVYFKDGTYRNLGGYASIGQYNPQAIEKEVEYVALYSSSGVVSQTSVLSLIFTENAEQGTGIKQRLDSLEESVGKQEEAISTLDTQVSALEDTIGGEPEAVVVEKTSDTRKYFSTETNPFIEGKTYNISAVLTVANAVFFGFSKIDASAYDANNMVVVFNKSAIGNYNENFIAPSTEEYPYYFLQSAVTGNSFVAKSIATPSMSEQIDELQVLMPLSLKGKKILMLGDSITQLPKTGTSTTGKGIVEYFAELTGATVIRGAVGGRHIRARRNVTSVEQIVDVNWAMATTDICKIVEQLVAGDFTLAKAGQTWLENNAPSAYDSYVDTIISDLESLNMNEIDVLTILGGTNDYANSVPLGDIDSDNNGLENGAWNEILASLSRTFPKLSVMVFTPIVKYVYGGNTVWCEDAGAKNSENLYLHDYAENNILAAKRFMCPACDLFYQLGINKENFYTYISSDKTHPIDCGFRCIAAKMATFVIANYNRY